MSDHSPTTHPTDTPIDPIAQRRSRLMLVALFSLFGFPLLLATFWLQMVKSSGEDMGSTARGELIDPAWPLQPFALTDAKGDEFDNESLHGIWTLLYLPKGPCEDTCQRNLYDMRQVRLALNQRINRVQRAVVLSREDQIEPALLAQHPGLRVAHGGPAERRQLVDQIVKAQNRLPEKADSIFLVDPLGNLMMRFTADLPPEYILKDLKHLLNVSRIG